MDSPGKEVLLMGNEAMARGALEAGITVAAAYPGNPSSEIIGSLAQVANEMNIYVEWSVNEKVALEVVAAAACSGCNGLTAMKQNGMNVASDFLLNLNLTGVRGGLVIIVADDPSGISSTNEEDSRIFAKLADLPLLEPSSFKEAKEMVRYGFQLSREISNAVIVRSVTRISHARGNVILGPLSKERPKPYFDPSSPLCALPASISHPAAHARLAKASDLLADSDFNSYDGPAGPELMIITCGAGYLFSQEAVENLSLESKVGILKIGTTWPLPVHFLLDKLKKTERVLFIEEVDPNLEDNVKSLYGDHNLDLPKIQFLGKRSAHMPDTGELSPGLIMDCLAKIFGIEQNPLPGDYSKAAQEALDDYSPSRALAFCAGCPHRASFWALKKALALDGRDGVVFGDIGCYALGFLPTGFQQAKTLHAMGSGSGMASGFGKLGQFGANQPAVALCGDSTFYHSAIPALINARHHGSDLLLIIMDNSATAMTGFQPHPGSPIAATGDSAAPIIIEDITRGLGIETVIKDPFDLDDTSQTIYELLSRPGTKALILRQTCALVRAKKESKRYKVFIDPEKCLGNECGCNRLCTRVLRCPGLNWNPETGKSQVDEAICVGCGVCADVCATGAIIRTPFNE